MENIFGYENYIDFLKDVTSTRGKRSGFKTELAAAMQSHPAYMSRILSGDAHLNLEQAERVASHLQLQEEERRYFFFLVEEARAGTPQVKAFFKSERKTIQQRRLNIKERIPSSETISDENCAIYYSSWHYAAIHVLCSIKKFSTPNQIAECLDLSVSTVRNALDFLEQIGLIKNSDENSNGPQHIHLEKTSPLIRQHHTNWRLKSIHSLDKSDPDDLRYSSVLSLSEQDAIRLKENMMEHLKEYLHQASSSPEEVAYAFCFDFFSLCPKR